MTYKEKWMQEHLEEESKARPMGCPVLGICPSDVVSCEECWDQEIPEEDATLTFEHQGKPISKVTNVKEEDDGVTVTVEPVIKDSGDRTEFASGAVRDMHEGKGRMDLLPWAAIMEVSKHCENGAKKYGEHNVDKGIPTSSLCDSAARHLAKYLDGWDDEPHLVAAAWNLLWAIQMGKKNPDLVNTPWRPENNKEV